MTRPSEPRSHCHFFGDAFATLARDSAASYRRAWRLPEAVIDPVQDWAELIARCSRPASRGRRCRRGASYNTS